VSLPAFLPSPPSNGLHLGPVFVHAYGLAYPARHILGLRLNFFVAGALCAVGLVWFVHTQRAISGRAARRGGALLAAAALLCLAGCGQGTRPAHTNVLNASDDIVHAAVERRS